MPNIKEVEADFIEKKRFADQAKISADLASVAFQRSEKKLKIVRRLTDIELEAENLKKELESIELQFSKPVFSLPKLLPDHSDVDSTYARDHLALQEKQIISTFEALTSLESPYVHADKLKSYILEHYEIEHPDYWMAHTSSKEPERWWKYVYDKCIERLDLVLGIVARKSLTGRRGVYALKKNLQKKFSSNKEPTLF